MMFHSPFFIVNVTGFICNFLSKWKFMGGVVRWAEFCFTYGFFIFYIEEFWFHFLFLTNPLL